MYSISKLAVEDKKNLFCVLKQKVPLNNNMTLNNLSICLFLTQQQSAFMHTPHIIPILQQSFL